MHLHQIKFFSIPGRLRVKGWFSVSRFYILVIKKTSKVLSKIVVCLMKHNVHEYMCKWQWLKFCILVMDIYECLEMFLSMYVSMKVLSICDEIFWGFQFADKLNYII